MNLDCIDDLLFGQESARVLKDLRFQAGISCKRPDIGSSFASIATGQRHSNGLGDPAS